MIRKRTRFLSVMLTLAMIVGLMPAMTLTASATGETTTPLTALKVGETNVSVNATAAGIGWNYDGNGTLTLSGAAISGDLSEVSAIYASGDLTIILVGEANTINANGCDGISVEGNILITGSGIINITDAEDGIYAYGGNVTISGGANVRISDCNFQGIKSSNRIEISGGANVEVSDCNECGLFSDNVDISCASLTAQGSNYAIYDTLTVTGSFMCVEHGSGPGNVEVYEDFTSGSFNDCYVRVYRLAHILDLCGVTGPTGTDKEDYGLSTKGSVCGVEVDFAGWYTDPGYLESSKLSGNPVNGRMYYARWTKNGKTVVTKPLDFTLSLADAADAARKAAEFAAKAKNEALSATTTVGNIRFYILGARNAAIGAVEYATIAANVAEAAGLSAAAVAVRNAATAAESAASHAFTAYNAETIVDVNAVARDICSAAEEAIPYASDAANMLEAAALAGEGVVKIPTGSGIEWNEDNKTLTLNGANILIPDSVTPLAIKLPNNAIIKLTDENTVSAGAVGTVVNTNGNLLINGAGTLNINGTDMGIYSSGIITISGAAVTAYGGNRAITGFLKTSEGLSVIEGDSSGSASADSGKNYVSGDYSTSKYIKIYKATPVSGGGGGGGSSEITVPVSGDENSVKVKAEVSGSKASVKEITAEDIAKAVGNEADSVVLVDLSGKGKNINAVTLTNKTVQNLADAKAVGSAELKLSNATVAVDDKALDAIVAQAGGNDLTLYCDTVSVSKMNSSQQKTVGALTSPLVIDAYFTGGSKKISDFKGGQAVIAVKYTLLAGKSASQVTGFYIADNGEKTAVPCTYSNGTAYVTASHFSYYVVSADGEAAACDGGANCPTAAFTDLNASKWYHEATDFVLSKGLMKGIEDKIFSPNGDVTRGMLVTILWRQAGEPASNEAMSFADVKDGKWYTEAIRWAAANEIVSGYSAEKFGPNDSITREQLATIIYNYEKKMNNGGFTGEWMFNLEFSDAGQISDYANEAMHWCVMNKIVNGFENNTLAPKGTATRAQVAQMLMNYLNK